MGKNREEKIIRDLLSTIGVAVNGPNAWDIKVNDQRFYRRVIANGSMGLGESYVEGWWDCSALDEFICKLILADLDKQAKNNWKLLSYALKTKIFNFQKISRAFEVGENIMISEMICTWPCSIKG
jgi:cyclopropane-fatty-acyl-phospholipid synthase